MEEISCRTSFASSREDMRPLPFFSSLGREGSLEGIRVKGQTKPKYGFSLVVATSLASQKTLGVQ